MKINPSPPAEKIVGSPQEVRDALAYERRHGYEVKILFFKMVDAWNVEVWYY